MIERIKQKRQNEEGFTLVELLVVIVILGILAAIVVFAVGGITDKGDSSATSADRSSLETAEEAFFANDKTPPSQYTTEDGLVTGKFLRAPSTKHDVCLNSGATDYVVGPQSAEGNGDLWTPAEYTAASINPAVYTCTSVK